MTFDQWLAENSMEYRGYTLRPGSVLKDGEPVLMLYSPLNANRDEAFEIAKREVDRLLAKQSESSPSTTSTTPLAE